MILGLSTATFTLLHVIISLIGIAAGAVMFGGLASGRRSMPWVDTFLVATAATSVTGFAFPNEHLTPAQVFGAVSLVLLALATAASLRFDTGSGWRRTFIITASIAQYLNTFVLVVQSFQKIGPLKALAPTQSESPFVVAQLTVLTMMIWVTVVSLKRMPRVVLAEEHS